MGALAGQSGPDGETGSTATFDRFKPICAAAMTISAGQIWLERWYTLCVIAMHGSEHNRRRQAMNSNTGTKQRTKFALSREDKGLH